MFSLCGINYQYQWLGEGAAVNNEWAGHRFVAAMAWEQENRIAWHWS
jgi:hypothetical protein